MSVFGAKNLFKDRTKEKLAYRKIQPRQYDEACNLCARVFDEQVAPQNPPQGRDTFRSFVFSKELRDAFHAGNIHFYGCFDDKKLVGVIGVKNSKPNAHISLLFVLPEYSNRGIGAGLIETALGRSHTKVTVNASANAEGFYKKLGFSRVSGAGFQEGLNIVPMKREEESRTIKALALAVSAILPAIIALIALRGTGIFPFGDKSFLIYDLKSQYIDFYNSFSRIFSGDLFYSLFRTFGGDNFTLNAYYLFSPFNLLLLPFSAEQMADAVLCLYLLKTAVAGLSFAICMRLTRLISCRGRYFWVYLPVASTAFALCGFAASYSLNVFWLDALILLPFVSLQTERAILGKKGAYIAVIAISLVINFYFGFLLFLFAMTAYTAYSRILGEHNKVLPFGQFFRTSLIGVMYSAVVTVPVFFGLFVTKLSPSNPLARIFERTGHSEALDALGLFFLVVAVVVTALTAVSALAKPAQKRRFAIQKKTLFRANSIKVIIVVVLFALGAYYYFALFDSVISLFPLSSDVNKTPLYTTISAVLLSTSIAFSKTIKTKKRTWLTALTLFWFLPSFIEPLYMVLHMGQQPLSYPGRFAFIFSFVILQNSLIAVSSYFDEGTHESDSVLEQKGVRSAAIFAVVVFMVIGISINTLNAFKNNEKAYYGYVERNDYIEFVQKNSTAVEAVKKIDDGFWRLEKTYNRSLNDAYTLGVSGISHYSSMYENEIINTLNLMGFSASAYWVQYRGATPVTDMLFGVEYILDKGDSFGFYQSELYEKIASEGEIDIYKNAYALPIAFVGSNGLETLVADTGDPFELQNKYVSVLAGTDILPFVEQNDIEADKTPYTSNSDTTNGEKFTYLEYKIRINTTGPLLMCIKSYKPVVSEVYVNDDFVSDYFTYDISGSLYLGTFNKGEEVNVTVISDSGLHYEFERFAVLDESKLELTYDKLSATILDTKVKSGMLEIKTEGEGTLFVTLPYSDGWRAKVDGKPARTFNGGSGFLCVELPGEGSHSVVLRYTPPGLWRGAVISILGLVCSIIIILDKKRISIKRSDQSK